MADEALFSEGVEINQLHPLYYPPQEVRMGTVVPLFFQKLDAPLVYGAE